MKKLTAKRIKYLLHKRKLVFKNGLKNIGYNFYAEPKPLKWVFLVGCYNSGTTLFHKILAEHPQIGSMPKEGRNFTNELPNAKDFGLPRLWAIKPELFYLDENSNKNIDVKKIKRQWAFMYNNPNRPVLLEKSIVNASRIRWLNKHFENAHFIALIRNGYSVAEGIHRKTKHSIDLCARQWSVSNRLMLNDLEHVKNKIILSYEDLTAQPKETLDKTFRFIGVEPLSKEIINKDFQVHERESKITNYNSFSMHSLSQQDIEIINKEAGEMLHKLNYTVPDVSINEPSSGTYT